jgi:molybdopterin molybdotransferase
MTSLITPARADELIAGLRDPVGTRRLPLREAAGLVLRQDVVADRDFPPFDRVMMDGLAVRFPDVRAGAIGFRVVGSAPAGRGRAVLPDEPLAALEVMTGAMLPEGADCIIPCEWYSVDGQVATLSPGSEPRVGAFIHPQGSDRLRGDVLLHPGVRIGPLETAVAASCGCASIEVAEALRIAVLATGDELVAIDEVPTGGMIRQSNAVALEAALRLAGYGEVRTRCLPDEVSAIREAVAAGLAECDVVILTGGVSKGRRDLVPPVLADLGARTILHGIAQKPGKPMGVWQAPGGGVVFGLPGNPVSALVCLHRHVLPALFRWSGGRAPGVVRRLVRGNFDRPSGLTFFLPVACTDGGVGLSLPVANSGDLAGLAGTSGFVEIDETFAEGSAAPYFPWAGL